MIHFIYIISCIPQKPVAPSNWLCTLKMIGNVREMQLYKLNSEIT